MLSETLSGTTDTLTEAAAKTVAGFTAQSFQQKNIAGDGSTVVDIYYNRNSYGVSYRYLNTPCGCKCMPAGASYRFGAAVTVAEAATAPGLHSAAGAPAISRCPHRMWRSQAPSRPTAIPAYTVEHYQQNLAGDGYDLVEVDTEHLTGETDTTATANPKAYTGFTFDGTVEGTVASGNIAGDGSLVLKLYYTRNSYEVTYALTRAQCPRTQVHCRKRRLGNTAPLVTVAEAATAKGHTFSGWSTGDFTMLHRMWRSQAPLRPTHSVTVEYYFDKVQDTDMTRVQSVTYGGNIHNSGGGRTPTGTAYTIRWTGSKTTA